MGISLVDAEVPGDLGALEASLREAVSANEQQNEQPKQAVTPPVTPQAETVTDGDDVPAKLRGKSRTEIIEYYRNLESAYGRQANDLGHQRMMTDKLLGLKRESDLNSNGGDPARAARPKVSTQELLDNPDEAIDRIVNARVAEREAKLAEEAAQQARARAAQTFLDHHPNYEQDSNDPEFLKWLNASQVRLRAAAIARSGDYTVADELLTEFKTGRVKPKVSDEPVNNGSNIEAANKAALESGTATEHAGKKTGKIYRRVDLMRLMVEKPDVYNDDAFQAEILKAYAEKRVR